MLFTPQHVLTGPYRIPYSGGSPAACSGVGIHAPSISTSIYITPNTGTFVTVDGDCKCGTNITSISDTLGNTWSNVASVYGSIQWLCGHCIGGNDTITVYFGTGGGTTSQYLMGSVNYPDVTQASPNDGNVGTYNSLQTSWSTPNLTTTNAHDRLVGMGYTSSASTVNPNSMAGYTTDLTCTYNDPLVDHQSLLIASRVVTSVGTYNQTTSFGGIFVQNLVVSLQALKQ